MMNDGVRSTRRQRGDWVPFGIFCCVVGSGSLARVTLLTPVPSVSSFRAAFNSWCRSPRKETVSCATRQKHCLESTSFLLSVRCAVRRGVTRADACYDIEVHHFFFLRGSSIFGRLQPLPKADLEKHKFARTMGEISNGLGAGGESCKYIYILSYYRRLGVRGEKKAKLGYTSIVSCVRD